MKLMAFHQSATKTRKLSKLSWPTLAGIIVVGFAGCVHGISPHNVDRAEPLTQKRQIVRREQQFRAPSLAAVATPSVENQTVPLGVIPAPSSAAITVLPVPVAENGTHVSGGKAQPNPTEAVPAALTAELLAHDNGNITVGLRQAIDRTTERLRHVERANEQLSRQLASVREAVQSLPAMDGGVNAGLEDRSATLSAFNVASHSEAPLAGMPPSASTLVAQPAVTLVQMQPASSPPTATALASQIVLTTAQPSEQLVSVQEVGQALHPPQASAAGQVALPAKAEANNEALGDRDAAAAAAKITGARIAASPSSVGSVGRFEAPVAAFPPSASTLAAQLAAVPAQVIRKSSPPIAMALAPQFAAASAQQPSPTSPPLCSEDCYGTMSTYSWAVRCDLQSCNSCPVCSTLSNTPEGTRFAPVVPKHGEEPSPTTPAGVDTSLPHVDPLAASDAQNQSAGGSSPLGGSGGQATVEEQPAGTPPEQGRPVRWTVVVLLLISALFVIYVRVSSHAKGFSRQGDAQGDENGPHEEFLRAATWKRTVYRKAVLTSTRQEVTQGDDSSSDDAARFRQRT